MTQNIVHQKHDNYTRMEDQYQLTTALGQDSVSN